jgi:hypothetical protein
MNVQLLKLSCIVAALAGICLFAYFNEWLIVRNPWHSPYHTQLLGTQLQKKEITLFFWYHDQWHQETIKLSVGEHLQEQALAIVHAWLNEAAQRGLLEKPCVLQAALHDARHQCLYLSFSTMLCNTQKSMREQLCVLEALLKTIYHNLSTGVQAIQLLVNHGIVKHPQLDLARPLPIVGFDIVDT